MDLELDFTQPIDRASAAMVQSYQMETYTYIYQSSYGSPEVDATQPKIQSALVSEDGLKVTLKWTLCKSVMSTNSNARGSEAPGVENPLFNPAAYYTLNQIPNEIR